MSTAFFTHRPELTISKVPTTVTKLVIKAHTCETISPFPSWIEEITIEDCALLCAIHPFPPGMKKVTLNNLPGLLSIPEIPEGCELNARNVGETLSKDLIASLMTEVSRPCGDTPRLLTDGHSPDYDSIHSGSGSDSESDEEMRMLCRSETEI